VCVWMCLYVNVCCVCVCVWDSVSIGVCLFGCGCCVVLVRECEFVFDACVILIACVVCLCCLRGI